MTHFYIVRHGLTDWNIEERIQGQTDIPLNDKGRQQSAQFARKLDHIIFSACYSSDLSRAYETAQILVEARQMEVEKDARLRECNFGIWEGKLRAELWAHGNQDGIETNKEIWERVRIFFKDAVEKHQGGHLLVVTHGGTMRTIVMEVLNLSCGLDEIRTTNNALVHFSVQDGQWTLEDIEGFTLPSS